MLTAPTTEIAKQTLNIWAKFSEEDGGILDNAIRHTPENGFIQIEVIQQQQHLRISIRDNGVGIDQSELRDIFEARYQARNCAQDKAIHVGLGLAISQRLMSFMHSQITVESELHQGSCFSFTLPMAT